MDGGTRRLAPGWGVLVVRRSHRWCLPGKGPENGSGFLPADLVNFRIAVKL